MSSLNGAMGYIVVPSLVEGFKLGSGYIATFPNLFTALALF